MARTASSIFLMALQTFIMSYQTYRGIKVQRSFCYVNLQSLKEFTLRNHPKFFPTFKMKVDQDFFSDFGSLNGLTIYPELK